MKTKETLLISSAALITALAIAGNMVSRRALNQELKRARAELEQLTPAVQQLRAVQAATAANQEILSTYHAWEEGSGLPMNQVFQALVEKTPDQMAVYHLTAAVEQPGMTHSPTCTLYLSGIATGALSAIDAKNRLNAAPALHRFCGEIKLASSQRSASNRWAFALEGTRTVEGYRP